MKRGEPDSPESGKQSKKRKRRECRVGSTGVVKSPATG